METAAPINIYTDDLSIEDAEAVFEVERIPSDPSVGARGGYWATLQHVPFGGTVMTREFLLLAIGVKALCKIEEDVSELISDDPRSYLTEDAA